VRCVKCNGTVTGTPINRTLHWHPNWVLVLFLIPPLYMIVFFIVSKRVSVSVPICEEHRRQRRFFLGVSCLLLAIGIVVFIVAFSIESYALEILALVIDFVAVLLGFSKGALVSTKKVDAQFVWLRGCCKEYRDSLPEFPDLR
jgi:hypothetical protein